MSTPEGDKAGSGGGTKMQGTGASVVGSLSGSGSGGGSGGIGATIGTGSGTGATAYPIDLASASKVLVRPTEKTNMPTTYRIGNSAGNQMRVVIPSNAAPQTFYRQAINLKQDTTNRTQITALPARTVTQTSITVSRPQTPTTYHVPARVPATVASIQGPRATITAPIRIPTPPISVANLNTYVRQSVPSRTSSPSTTIISQGTTNWMPNVQVQVPTQLIRANSLTQAPRARVVAQTIPANQTSNNVNNATITANVVAHQASTPTNQQNVSIGGANQSQAFVATLATAVLPPQRQLTSTLVYTNNNSQQPYATGTNPQRLTLATTLSPQRPTGVRPIQRLPTSNLGVRVTAGGISIRTPSIPVLAPTTVLTTIAPGTAGSQGRTGTGSTANISNTIPARIIQVQNPQSGQVISGGRLPTNLVNIQPLIVSNNRFPHSNIQPSLTIAQVGKLTPVAASPVSNISNTSSNNQDTACGTTTLQTASGQQIVVSSSQVSGALNSSGGSGSTATIITGNLISNQSGGGGTQSQGQITQIVNVNPGSVGSGLSGQTPQIVTVSQGQVISTQQAISVSNSGGAGSTTVIPIPLAITGRNASIPVSVATLSANQNPINIVTGGSTITGIVRTTTSGAGAMSTSAMPSILPIAKVTPQQLSGLSTIDSSLISSASYSVAGTGASLYIQTRPQQPSTIVTTVASSGKSSTLNVVSGNASGTIGNTGTTFLPTSTFYYERVTPSPASSSQSATTSAPGGAIGLIQSVSALTSTTITTTSSLSGPVFSISSSALNSATISTGSSGTVTGPIVAGLSSSQLSSANVITTTVSSLPYAPAAGSFAIVQTSGRNISGPIHGIVSSSSAVGTAHSVQCQQQSHPQQQQQTNQLQQSSTQIQSVPVRFHPQLLVDGGQTQQIIMTGASALGTGQQSQSAHMLIPVNPAGKLESPQSSILRKRGLEGSPIKMGKDLTQTLIAMGKERAREIEQHREQRERERELSPPPSRPPSTDGSTTVSATSSPGIDQQEHEEIKAMAFANRNANSDLPFKPVIEEIFHRNQPNQLASEPTPPPPPLQGLSTAFHNSSASQHQNSTAATSNNGNYEQSPRKKPRKQNVAEGLKSVANSLQFYANNELDNSYRMDISGPPSQAALDGDYVPPLPPQQQQQQPQQPQHSKHRNSSNAAASVINNNSIANNVAVATNSVKVDGGGAQSSASCGKDGAATPKDVALVRKARNASLLETYKQSWKAANNHFHRYTDVKQREERRPTIVDIANQSHVLQKVNGWKIYHLSAQIEDLCELESQAYDKLDQMLKTMEATPKPSAEIERINELLKGNMQRSKIIIDGINEARTQIMKIFDHKTHVSDIIQRCASKRNFKKREKT
ncbi:mucin-2 [Toxorhynchites rutilus septentrionalis]|uniref:mucin-2 n=1 Tax=Toxorhynchites rutilus septentrionalis TaxID=329112 RepID=UPI002479B784|nr:mucin-2 [Toxorhynchites rutilus septentrionalis]